MVNTYEAFDTIGLCGAVDLVHIDNDHVGLYALVECRKRRERASLHALVGCRKKRRPCRRTCEREKGRKGDCARTYGLSGALADEQSVLFSSTSIQAIKAQR